MLLKSAPENFNPQIHTEELSLTSNSDKHFEVHKGTLSRYERYCKFTSFLIHTNRIDGGVKQGKIKRANQEIEDNAYRVQYRRINIMPAISFGAVQIGTFFDQANPSPDMTAVVGVTYTGGLTAQTVVTNVVGSIAIKHDPANNIDGSKMNPTDQFTTGGGLGTNFYITNKRFASTEDHYVYDFKVIGAASDFNPASLAEDEVLGESGSLFGEGSLKGYQRSTNTYWKIFYSFIQRYTLSFTGNAMRQKRVHWTQKTVNGIPGNGESTSRFWQFEKEWEADEYFAIFLELGCRYNKSTMDVSTHEWYTNFGKNLLTMSGLPPEVGITAPRSGDGWVTAIKGTIDLTYNVNTGLAVDLLEGICNILASNSPIGQEGNTFIVLGDSVFAKNWDRAMKRLMGWDTASNGLAVNAINNGNITYNVTGNQAVELGFTVAAYHYMNNKFIFINDELMNHPGLNNRNGGLVGNGDGYFINVSAVDGVSNFELFSGGNGRFYRKVYVDGLFSLSGKQSMYGSSGFDGGFCHYLAELLPLCYFEETCCILRGTGKFNGGALSGNPKLGNFPSIV